VVYANNEPAVLTQKAIPLNALYVAEYADLVSAVVVSSDTMVEQHPDQVRAFVGAFLKGLEDVLNDPDAAFEISKDYIEGLEENAAAQRAVLETTLAYWRPHSGTDLGEFSRSAWEQAQEVMLQADLIKKPVPTEALFTNKFIP
jgi:NitT/TauT family transport system substrate-binding protein